MSAVPAVLSALVPAMGPNPIDEGTLRPGLDPSQVTPGMIGFLMSLLLAVAVILLVLDFNRRNRRLRYRAEYAERRAAEERAGGCAGPDGGPAASAGEESAAGRGDAPGASPAGERPAEGTDRER
ncbi:hypothetical protein MRU69_06520 [Kocuria flava]|uniref:hypothetical protein n=1 Tax=Kocuria flava TaxID=446860 RepID=UPI001FF159C2|nr:hypothetical protein [Kocuria flava]MCJ8504522.1 hypothetical protein [Kocuria flava]